MKRKCLLLSLLTLLLLTACSIRGVNTSIFFEDNNIIADKTFNILVDSIKNKEKDKLELLFSKNARNEIDDFEKCATDLIEFIQGDIVSLSDAAENGVGAEYTANKGKKTKSIQPVFTLQTTTGKYYFAIKECTRDDFDNDNIGVLSIYVISSEDWRVDYTYLGDGKWLPGINIDKSERIQNIPN